MKTTAKVLAVIAVMATAGAAYAAGGEMAAQVPGKTLADFQAQFAGTKPVVAIDKYLEYQALQLAPKPTLAQPRLREEGRGPATGTKPVLQMLERREK